jgi:hypothetical protein
MNIISFVNDGFSVNAQGFLVPELLTNNLGTATAFPPAASVLIRTKCGLTSHFLGRIVYNFDDRYLFTANFRKKMVLSKFGPNTRWGKLSVLRVGLAG